MGCQHRAWPGATETLSHLISASQSSTKRVKLGQIGHILVRMESSLLISSVYTTDSLHCIVQFHSFMCTKENLLKKSSSTSNWITKCSNNVVCVSVACSLGGAGSLSQGGGLACVETLEQ